MMMNLQIYKAHIIEESTVNKIQCFEYFLSHISGYFYMRTKQRSETKTFREHYKQLQCNRFYTKGIKG